MIVRGWFRTVSSLGLSRSPTKRDLGPRVRPRPRNGLASVQRHRGAGIRDQSAYEPYDEGADDGFQRPIAEGRGMALAFGIGGLRPMTALL